jgi:hypothetical protein
MQSLAVAILLAYAGVTSTQFVGTWEGEVNDLPAVKITIVPDRGSVTGSIGFVFQQRRADGSWEAKDIYTTPFLMPSVQGGTLTFEAKHHKSHGSTELGPNVRFQMTITNGSEARLFKIGDGHPSGSGLKLTKMKGRTQEEPRR